MFSKSNMPSHNACYGKIHLAAPLNFNSAQHYLGFTSVAHSDVTIVKYSFYEHKGLYWYCVVIDETMPINSLFFVGLSNCVRDFRSFCAIMCWEIDDSLGLSRFVAQFNNVDKERTF